MKIILKNNLLNIIKNLHARSVSMKTKIDMDIMKMEKVYKVNVKGTLAGAKNLLLKGEIIGVPTDTVYGLACDANNEAAIKKLYTIKGRDRFKPVAICVRDLKALRFYGHAEHLSDDLLKKLLPGPITIVIERTENLSNRFLNPSTSKIGIRIPDFKFIQDLCEVFHEQPIALTSANKSSEPSTLCINEFQTLWPLLGGVFDGGQIGCTEEQRSASTVIDLTVYPYYKVVRDGVALQRTLKILNDFGFRPNDIS